MIKYTILPWENKLGEEYKARKNNWVRSIFSAMERNGIEDKIYGLKENDMVIIDSDSTGRLMFTCTGANKGYFTQVLVDPSGFNLRDSTPEFTFE